MDVTLSPETGPGTTCDGIDLVVLVNAAPERSLAVALATELAQRSSERSTVHQLEVGDPATAEAVSTLCRNGAIPVVTMETLDEVLQRGVPQVIAIGPHVQPRHTIADKPLLVALDSVVRTEPLIEAVEAFATPNTPRIIVTQVIPPSATSAGFTIGRESAKFASHLDPHVEAKVVSGDRVGETIAETARVEDAGLVIARSWHLRHADHSTASTSISIVAEAPCPVLIIN